MKNACVLVCLVLCILFADCYKILGIFPSQERNNYLTYKELFRELAHRNHEVTVVAHFGLSDPPENYKEIQLSDEFKFKGRSYEDIIESEIQRVPFETILSARNGHNECKTLMDNHHVLHMIRSRPRFDVIIVESFNSDCGLALASNLSAPYIAFAPQIIQSWQHNRLGINFNPSHVSQPLLPYGKHPQFLDRLMIYILNTVENCIFYVCSQVPDRVLLYKYLGIEMPTLESIASNTSLVFLNTHPSVFGGTPKADNVIDLGGIHIRSSKPLPSVIESFLNDAEHGVIYVNLGSVMQDSSLPLDKLNGLISSFKKLPLRVLWKWDGQITDLPKNVLTMRWFPHYDVLKHPNVLAVVGHAGILSSIEAIDAGVPMIAVPLFGSQYGTAAALRDAGVATILKYEDLNEQNLISAINEVLDPKMQQQSKHIAQVWHDRPMSAMETAIYWVEYVARYNGAPNLVPPSVGLPWYQLNQWDVLLVVGLAWSLVGYAFIKLFSILCCCICKIDEPLSVEIREERSRSSKTVKFE